MRFTTIVIFTIVVAVSKALVYNPFGYDNTDEDYNDGIDGYIGDGVFVNRDKLNKVDREKLLALISALVQQGNNQYNPFTDLFTFKGHKGRNRVSWRKWLNWNKRNANLGT